MNNNNKQNNTTTTMKLLIIHCLFFTYPNLSYGTFGLLYLSYSISPLPWSDLLYRQKR